MVHVQSHLKKMQFSGKRVFVRADINVPLNHGKILNDHRLQATLPTLRYILEHGGRLIVATHLGRPKDREQALSTQHLIPWFENQGFEAIFASDVSQAEQESRHVQGKQLVLLENLRFFPGEKTADPQFAQQLKNCADYYVDDAFATLHRTDTSVTLLPELFDAQHRTIGFLVEHELAMLNKLLEHPRRPFVLILGGGKVNDKLPLLKNMLEHVQTILLCPAIVFTFLKSQGISVGKSLVDDSALDFCTEFIAHAKQQNVNIVFPIDYQIAEGTFSGPLTYCESPELPKSAVGISIGKKTAELFARHIMNAGTTFYNGTMGTLARPETLGGIRAVFEAMAESKSFTVIGGGDSVAVAQKYGFDTKIDLLSTGGGATLAYLGGEALPGLQPFVQKKSS